MGKKAEQYNVVIIGGDTAGLTVVIYCRRVRLKTLVIKKALVGRLVAYTNGIKNYPGFSEGSTDLGLMELFHRRAKKFGTKFKLIDMYVIQLEGDAKVAETFHISYEYHSVIIANGGKPRLIGMLDEDRFLYDKGTSSRTTCDAVANTGETIVVIGSDDAAIEEGMFLTKFASKMIISVMHEEGRMNYNEIAREEAPANPKMGLIWNTLSEEFRGNEEHPHSVALKDLKTSKIIDMPVGTCFPFIGYVPNTEVFKGIINMGRSGYVLTSEKIEANMPGVFVAGDARDKLLKQVAVAVGDGAIAGYVAEKYLTESGISENQIMDPSLLGLVYIWNMVETVSRGLLPVIEEFEQEHGRSVKVTRVDIYKSTGIASCPGTTTAPDAAFIRDGKLARALAKDITKEALKAALQYYYI